MKYKIAISMLLFVFAWQIRAQTPAFEVVSIRRASFESHESRMPNGNVMMSWKQVEFKGVRLSGDAPLSNYVQFACSPLLTPFREEHPAAAAVMGGPGLPVPDYYQIEAIAPVGTTIDQARVMLRQALAERLGFQYHLTDRETPVFNLVRGNGALKLKPAPEEPPNGEFHRTPWELHVKSYSMADFGNFLSGIARRPVVDKTGIQGRYQFDLDWNLEVQDSMSNGGIDPGIAIDGVKTFGLKLEPGTEMRKFLVVDHMNKEPTPN